MMRFTIVVFALSLIAGCATSSYYAQAVGGQLALWRDAEPISSVLARAETPQQLRAKLVRVQEIRRYASRELQLPANGSYTKYADLKRPFVVWNVFAANELSVRAKEWCFLIVGCISYRGYFSKDAAEAYAAELKRDGYDVYIGGVPAYSTLGYFDDPVLSTFIHYPDTELARLIFHELAHQAVYVKDDSTFNESFAAAVELEGVTRWIKAYATPADFAAFSAWQARKQDYLMLIEKYRAKLQQLYRSSVSVDEKRAGKVRLFQEMNDDYQRLKAGWGGYAGYDRVFDQNLNNAFIVSTALYTQLVPAFRKLMEKNDGDLPHFYRAARELASEPKDRRDLALAALMGGGSSLGPLAAPNR